MTRMRLRHLFPLLKDAASEWVDDGAMRLSSSLAYYAIFSLAPLLVIMISMAGLVFGEDAAEGNFREIAHLAGKGAVKPFSQRCSRAPLGKRLACWRP